MRTRSIPATSRGLRELRGMVDVVDVVDWGFTASVAT